MCTSNLEKEHPRDALLVKGWAKWCGIILLSWGLSTILGLPPKVWAQPKEGPLQFYGYFQNSFEYTSNNHSKNTTFVVQQLNLIAQKDLAPKFRSYVNFQFLNNYDSSKLWGSSSLTEAWVRYNASPKFKLKLGMQIPVFNQLNEIKTRTPLLPYIIRPIPYENALQEIINIEEFVPQQAFVQVQGELGSSEHKMDYALFVGNSPSINNDQTKGQTGADTSSSVLVGGRIGYRLNQFEGPLSEFNFGISSSFDRVSSYSRSFNFPGLDSLGTEDLADDFIGMPRVRLAGDLSVYLGKLYLQSELIGVYYTRDSELIDRDKFFFYATLGYVPSEKWEFYMSYWSTEEFDRYRNSEDEPSLLLKEKVFLDIYTFGVKYNITPRLVVKGQYVRSDLDVGLFLSPEVQNPIPTEPGVTRGGFHFIGLAISVFF